MSSDFFQNKECEYFPCHKVEDETGFNCLFCYCPLYALAKNCGGDFCYTAKGIKDCSKCTVPHSPDASQHIQKHLPELFDKLKADK